MVTKALTAIGVYALADKYDVDGLRTLALEQIPDPITKNMFKRANNPNLEIKKVIEAHYKQCVLGDCALGRRICLAVIMGGPSIAKGTDFELLAKKYPALAIDMYHAGRANDGKLW